MLNTIQNKTIMKTLIYFIALLLLFGCNTTKKLVKTNANNQVETTVKTEQKTDLKADVKVVSQATETILENDSVIVTETEIQLSKPDSTGKQHAEKVINRTIASGKKKQTETKTNNETVVETAQSNAIKSDVTQKQHENISVDSKIVVKRFPWIKLVLIAVAVVAGFVLYRKFGYLIRK